MDLVKRSEDAGVPFAAQQLTNRTRTPEDPDLIPDLTPWVGVQRCGELWCRLQMQLRSPVALVMAVPGRCSSDLTPSLGTSICLQCDPKKQKKKKKVRKK